MAFDYSELTGKIIAKYGTRSNFAKAMNLSKTQLSLRLNNQLKDGWSVAEMLKACDLLGIPHSECERYFFVKKVQKTDT